MSAGGGHPAKHVHRNDLVHRPRHQGRASGSPGRVSSAVASRSRDKRGRIRAFTRNGLRIDGTLAVTAQSPSDTSIFVRSRINGSCAGLPRCEPRPRRAQIHVVGKILAIHQRAVDQVDARTLRRSAARPGRERTCGSLNSRRAKPSPLYIRLIATRSRIQRQVRPPVRLLGASAIDRPFSVERAAVGQT